MEQYLKDIIRGMCNNGLNVSATARALHYHKNTMFYNLRKIKKLTGLDPRDFYDAQKLLEMIDMEDAEQK